MGLISVNVSANSGAIVAFLTLANAVAKIKLPFGGIPMNESTATAVVRGMPLRSHLIVGEGSPRGGEQLISVERAPNSVRIDCGTTANCLRISLGEREPETRKLGVVMG